MSKSPKERPIPPPKSPPPTEKPPSDNPTQEDPPPPLIVELVNIDAVVLGECSVGEPVTVCWEQTPLTVTTPAGVRLGDIRIADVPKVRRREYSQGVIVAINYEAVRCAVEVL